MNPSWRISRRTMLCGVGAGVALPLLDVMRPLARAAAPTVPPVNRMCYLFFPNGVADGGWAPAEVDVAGRLVRLNRWMTSLEPFASDVIIPQRMWTPQGNGHGAGDATWLTGGSYDSRRIDAGGTSVDQLAARHLASQTLLPSLELSLEGEGFFSKELSRNSISWTSPTTPAPREIEPRVVFDRMFRAGEGTADRSVLDLVQDHARTLRAHVSRADQQKLDEYLESIRGIERRLDFAGRQASRAQQEGLLTDSLRRPAAGIPTSHQEYCRLMLDMIVLAFWADATRVCTFMLDHGQSNRYFNFIRNVEGTWHALSHYKDISGKTEDDDGMTSWSSVTSKQEMYNMVTQWHHEQFAYFLGRLKSIPEGGGTLLDNSMILYGSSLADGHEHAAENLPLIIAGRGGGTIRTGRLIKYERDRSLSSLHLAFLQRMGLPASRFAECDAPMEELST